MGLDITIHRKGVPYGSDFWINGRIKFGPIKNLMVEKYNYQYGTDYLITWEVWSDLISIIESKMREYIENDEFIENEEIHVKEDFYKDFYIYNNFKNFLYNIVDDVRDKTQNWYFEATW